MDPCYGSIVLAGHGVNLELAHVGEERVHGVICSSENNDAVLESKSKWWLYDQWSLLVTFFSLYMN
jgi:hypothetical protein